MWVLINLLRTMKFYVKRIADFTLTKPKKETKRESGNEHHTIIGIHTLYECSRWRAFHFVLTCVCVCVCLYTFFFHALCSLTRPFMLGYSGLVAICGVKRELHSQWLFNIIIYILCSFCTNYCCTFGRMHAVNFFFFYVGLLHVYNNFIQSASSENKHT